MDFLLLPLQRVHESGRFGVVRGRDVGRRSSRLLHDGRRHLGRGPCAHERIRRGEALPTKPLEAVYKPGESHGIPYRSLVPQSLKNVIVAGRCICAERRMQGTTRIMAACLSTGEAAGIAAAQALEMDRPDMHRVDTDRLRARLREVGAYIL